jgi:hypothetical protein
VEQSQNYFKGRKLHDYSSAGDETQNEVVWVIVRVWWD